MLENLLSCIIACFNVGALHVLHVRDDVLRNGRRRFRWVVIESLRLGIGDFGCERLRSDKAFGVTDMVPDLRLFGRG